MLLLSCAYTVTDICCFFLWIQYGYSFAVYHTFISYQPQHKNNYRLISIGQNLITRFEGCF